MNDINYKNLIAAALSEMNELPTAKQINFAKEISEVLDIPLPEDKTKAAYTKFISDHIEEYKEVMSECETDSYWYEFF